VSLSLDDGRKKVRQSKNESLRPSKPQLQKSLRAFVRPGNRTETSTTTKQGEVIYRVIRTQGESHPREGEPNENCMMKKQEEKGGRDVVSKL